MVRWISHLHHGACYWVDVIGNILSWKLMCEDFSDCHTCLSQFQLTSQFSFLLPPFKMICQRTNALSVHARVVLVPGLSHISSSRFSGSQRLLCSDLNPTASFPLVHITNHKLFLKPKPNHEWVIQQHFLKKHQERQNINEQQTRQTKVLPASVHTVQERQQRMVLNYWVFKLTVFSSTRVFFPETQKEIKSWF